MVTGDERRALQLEAARNDAKFWEAMQESNEEMSLGQHGLATLAERNSTETKQAAENAAKHVAAAKDRITRLERGEDIGGATKGSVHESALSVRHLGRSMNGLRAGMSAPPWASPERPQSTPCGHSLPLTATTVDVPTPAVRDTRRDRLLPPLGGRGVRLVELEASQRGPNPDYRLSSTLQQCGAHRENSRRAIFDRV